MRCTFYTNKKSGQAALVAVMLFLMISLAILGAISFMSLTRIQGANDLIRSRKSYINAESGLEDAAFRVSNVMAYASSYAIALNRGVAGVEISSSAGTVTIKSRGDVENRYRRVAGRFIVIPSGTIPFPSALGAGFLGITLQASARIENADPTKTGNVFSNGTIDGSNGTGDIIMGNATVARPIANDEGTNLADYGQRNSDPAVNNLINGNPPPASYKVGDILAQSDAGQSFIMPITAYAVQAKIYMKKVGNPSAIHAYVIPTDTSATVEGGKPYNPGTNNRVSEVRYASGDSRFTTQWQWVTFEFNAYRYTIENEKYWLVFEVEGAPNSSNYYEVGASLLDTAYEYGQNNCYGQTGWCNSTPDNYTGCSGWPPSSTCFGKGAFKYSQDATVVNPTWSFPGARRDIAFRIFMGEETKEYVDGTSNQKYVTKAISLDVGNPGSDGAALKANTIVARSDITGDAYYQNVDLGSGTVIADSDDTSQPCSESPSSGLCHNYNNPDEPAESPLLFQGAGGERWQKLVYKWKGIATTTPPDGIGGTTSGTVVVTGPVSLGPRYITGGLECSGNGVLTLTGVVYVASGVKFTDNCQVYVTGTVTQNGKINSLDGYIISEGSDTSYNTGKVDVLKKAQFSKNDEGPDRTGYIYVYSLHHSMIDPAEPANTIELSSDADYGGGAFLAPYGEVRITGNAKTIAIGAAHIQALNSSVVKYEDGVKSPMPPQDGSVTTAFIPDFFEFHEIE